MDKADIYGKTGGHSKANGKMGKCMVKVLIYGKMAANIKENTLMIKSMVLENIIGQMVKFFRALG
jgi:hypothetical protein